MLADFNERGFRIMNSMHRREGPTRCCSPCDFKTIGGLLKARGWQPVRFRGDDQEGLVAYRACRSGEV